mgnify:CR=1 FL=1
MNKKILIFGGDSDIAAAVKDLNPDTIQILYADCDVRNSDQIYDCLVEYKPDAVVNCAGISNVQLVKDSNIDNWIQEIDVNLVGSYRIARECANLGIDTMIFLASVAGKYGKPEHSGYSASKCGTISLVQSLAFEGHKSYAISPGRVDTKMREMDFPGEDPRTRLTTHSVADVILECIDGRYEPGDNIIYRKRGFRTLRRVDKGQPWKKYLNVQPYGTPKEI